MSYEVEAEGYKGPIGLLLSLITSQKVDLWELSVSGLVDDYLNELERMRVLDLEIATEFLVVASTLLELKCRRLFPSQYSGDLDEDFAFFEERDLLLARLLEIKTYRDVSGVFLELIDKAAKSLPHAGMLDEPYASMMPDLLLGITPERLANSLARFAIPELGDFVDTSHLPEHPVSISQVARDLVLKLIDIRQCSFETLMVQASTRFEVVVGFLAVLELYRQARILINQENSLGEIVIEWIAEEFSTDELDEFLENSGFHLAE
ncbi:MAG: segregation/condensation protein A [Acidimicrobiaceae bacterium]|nr:segregation/condensation protein A [Acidimicrobiaceae bacterium]